MCRRRQGGPLDAFCDGDGAGGLIASGLSGDGDSGLSCALSGNQTVPIHAGHAGVVAFPRYLLIWSIGGGNRGSDRDLFPCGEGKRSVAQGHAVNRRIHRPLSGGDIAVKILEHVGDVGDICRRIIYADWLGVPFVRASLQSDLDRGTVR